MHVSRRSLPLLDMLIQCPSCGARAKLPDNKEGAKVRCSECERIYVAREPGAKSKKSQASLVPIGIGAGAVALGGVLFVLTQRGSTEPAPKPPEVVPVVAPVVDLTGWDSPLVKHVRNLHDVAWSRNETLLQNEIDFGRAWARVEAQANEAVEPDDAADAGGDVGASADPAPAGASVDPDGYELLEPDVRLQFVAELLDGLLSEEPDNLVGQWKPYDGSVLAEGDDTAHVRLTLQPRDESQGVTRYIDWKLTKSRSGWKAWSWERWISPEELLADRQKKSASKAKKTLSDGSIVFEAEVEKVEWMPETSAEDRAHISSLIDTLLDLEDEDRSAWIAAQDEIKVIGKPAIPGLLNRFADIEAAGWEIEENPMMAQRLHITLMDITGYVTTFNPHEALGGTDERRESGVKQWFFWYNRHFKKFDKKPEETDLLEESWEPRTEAEQREYDRMKRKIEEEGGGR